ncbi:MAG: hypothetical protein FJZ62_06380 [Chlamydiae bacterium]|nr:hypothetical protein [Chlamydiota bacterium]
MKKILISAASIAVLTTGASAIADHNYVGLGLGWTFARAQTKESLSTTVGGALRSTSINSKAKDNGLSGKLLLGRAFDLGSVTFLTEATLGLDSSKAKNESTKLVYTPAAGGTVNGTTKTFLQRQGILGLTAGLSTVLARDISGHVKASVLLSRFTIKTTTSYAGTGAGGPGGAVFANRSQPNYSTKAKTKWGFGLTVGGSKALTDNLSLGIDYTFEMFQKIKLKGSSNPAQLNSYSGTMNPQYHTVMMTLSQKI